MSAATRLLAALLAIACAAPAQHQAEPARGPAAPGLAWIRQKPKATVGGIRLALGDVADVDALDGTTAAHLRALDLGEIPSKGRQLLIARETILESVARASAGAEIRWDGDKITQVDLRLFSLSGEEVAALGRRHVARALGAAASDATFGPTTATRGFECVAGRWSTRVVVRNAPDERFSGAVRLELVAIADGIERAAQPFVVEVVRKGKVLVAARDLSPGTPVKAEDVTQVERNLAAVGPDSVDVPERLVGMVLARRVPAGQVLTTRDFRLPPVIERDDVIQVRYRSGALKITGLGRAQAPGAPGERIPVINLSSGKVVHAVIVDSRTVEVATGLPDPQRNP
jgi:flagella basal body P-ring formation protein FlgA